MKENRHVAIDYLKFDVESKTLFEMQDSGIFSHIETMEMEVHSWNKAWKPLGYPR